MRRAERIMSAIAVVIAVADVAVIGVAVSRAGGPSAAHTEVVAGRTQVVFPAPAATPPSRSGGRVDIVSPTEALVSDAPTTTAAPQPGSRPDILAPAVGVAPAPARPAAPETTSSGIQVLGESRSIDTPSAAATESVPPTSETVTGPVLLAVSADGTVIRAERGRCPSAAPVSVDVPADLGRGWNGATVPVAQVLALGALPGGHVWVVGADSSCRPARFDSIDAGRTWRASPAGGVWSLSPDPDSSQVVTPGGLAAVGCVPRMLDASGGSFAAVGCTDGAIRITDDGGSTWTGRAAPPRLAALALGQDGRGTALAATASCPAQAFRTVDGARTWTAGSCLGASGTGSAAPAIAAAGDTVVAQVAGTVYVSRDAGASWSRAFS